MILRTPGAISNPFFLLLPHWARLPMVILATAATVIASQAVISGAFSVSRQAGQLGLLPPLTVRQTSESEAGQVFLPGVNAVLFIGVMAIMLSFRSSAKLATAYGVSVTGALVVDTILLIFVAALYWHWSKWKLFAIAVCFGGVEVTFLAANLTKVFHGGWLPLLIAAAVFTVMTTWHRGREIVTSNRAGQEGLLTHFIAEMEARNIPRVPGTAVFPHPSKDSTPLALRANLDYNHVVHEHVVIVSIAPKSIPHVIGDDHITVDNLGSDTDGIVHLTLAYGFYDRPDIPGALTRHCQVTDDVEFDFDPATASYFLSRATLTVSKKPGMRRWRKRLFIGLAHNAPNPAATFGLPERQTVVMGTQLDV